MLEVLFSIALLALIASTILPNVISLLYWRKGRTYKSYVIEDGRDNWQCLQQWGLEF